MFTDDGRVSSRSATATPMTWYYVQHDISDNKSAEDCHGRFALVVCIALHDHEILPLERDIHLYLEFWWNPFSAPSRSAVNLITADS